jgi:hypothetical protein
MTLRNALGGHVSDLLDQVNALLDSEDALIVLFDRRRMVSYTHGFAASPSQLELLSNEIERSVRNAVGAPSTTRKEDRRIQPLRRHDRGQHSGLADAAGQSGRPGPAADGNRRGAAGRLLRLAGDTR